MLGLQSRIQDVFSNKAPEVLIPLFCEACVLQLVLMSRKEGRLSCACMQQVRLRTPRDQSKLVQRSLKQGDQARPV